MSSQKPLTRSLIGFIVFLAVAGASTYAAITYRQPVIDMVRAQDYEPSRAASQLRDDLQLTDKGKLYFDTSETVLQSSTTFNQSCLQQTETKNPILGCYYLQRIFVYDITNEKLDGIEQTTAAHEVLHAAYERMSEREKTAVDTQLQLVYKSINSSELDERMAYYQKTEPGEEMNELHSILGTEFRTLSPELEEHYKQYFTDRQVIVAFYEQYDSVFSSVQAKLTSLLEEINNGISKINQDIKQYNVDIKALESDIAAYQRRTYTSQAEASADFSELKAREDQYNQRAKAINQDIQRVNQLKQGRNKLVEEYNSLNQSINSSIEPTPSL